MPGSLDDRPTNLIHYLGILTYRSRFSLVSRKAKRRVQALALANKNISLYLAQIYSVHQGT